MSPWLLVEEPSNRAYGSIYDKSNGGYARFTKGVVRNVSSCGAWFKKSQSHEIATREFVCAVHYGGSLENKYATQQIRDEPVQHRNS